MLNGSVIVGGLLLATGMAGAQVPQDDSARASQRVPLQQSPAPQEAAPGGVSFFTGPAVRQSPAPQEGGALVSFFTDPLLFEQVVASTGKLSKGQWNFKPDNAPADSIVGFGNFLDIFSHPVVAPGIWDNADGTTHWPPDIDNVQFVSNLNPQATFVPGSGLFYAKNGFAGINNNVLGADFFVESFDIISGPPAGDNHTAISLEVMQLPGFGFPPPVFHISVYNKQEVPIGKFIMDWTINAKLFVGIITNDGSTIGRVDIWDASGGAEGISSIALYTGQQPSCQWDCAFPQDKIVGINDFLAVLAGWGLPGPCDFDGGGVGINDFLKILAHWGPCPAPINDECAGKIFIDRFDSGATHTEHFDMYGATPSTEVPFCVPAPVKDIWYCLQNNSPDKKIVTLTGTVDLMAEVTAGCDCANPGPLVTCGRLIAAVPTSFQMQSGDQFCIRLHNDLGLPNDIIKGDLIITNQPAPPDDLNVFLDEVQFNQHLQDKGKFSKLDWNFNPHALPPDFFVELDSPLDINTHGLDPDDPWTDAAGLNLWPPEVDNIQFASNLNPGGPFVPGGIDSLAFLSNGFNGLNNNALSINFGGSSLAIISGPPAGDNHTAIGLELVDPLPDGVPAQYRITVYDKVDQILGIIAITVDDLQKVFLGVQAKNTTIGWIDIAEIQSLAAAISRITAWQFSNPFGCPGQGDCCIPNGGLGCNNTDCCRRVCAIDPFCCDTAWDQICADEAATFPQCNCGLKVIFPGDDCWATPCGNTQATLNLPAGFFGPGCLPFSGIVQLGGQTGFIDTKVARLGPMVFDDNNLPQTQTIPIELIQLDLVSCSPITVSCLGGPQQWDVEVHLENPQPQGQMTATKVTPTNGVYDATLPVDPRFTFIQVGGPGLIASVDLGGFQLDTLDAPFKQGPIPGFSCSPDFHPGWGKGPNGEPCCQETCHENPGGDHLHCTVPPKCQPQCPPSP